MTGELEDRKGWMAILAKSTPEDLGERVAQLGSLPEYRFLRPPETGLTMVRGRAGGTGQPFNLGEMPLTRCVVQLENSGAELITGLSYVAGRSKRHAQLAALCDALLQHTTWQETVMTQVVIPLAELQHNQKAQEAGQVDATRVNFFTLLRGES